MIRFYSPDIETTLALPESDSGHCIRVLRMHAGDVIEVVDGRGNIFTCVLADEHSKHTSLQIVSRIEQPKVWIPSITVAVAPTKHADRMEWLVEKLVEIGIDRFVPLRCERSERKELKRERIEKIAVSAMKQSLKAVLPIIDDTTPLRQFLAEQEIGAGVSVRPRRQRFVGYCDEGTPRQLLAKAYTPGADVTILIGPEGDFSPAEIQACFGAGYSAVTMGDNRLRTETAALVGVDTIHVINQLHS